MDPRTALRSRDMAKRAVRPTARTRRQSLRNRRAETPARLRARLKQIIARLEQAYPDATCALHHHNPLELLVATILSAQSTDARVNMVTPALFTKYRTARDFAAADPRVFEQEIHSTGFFRNKTKSILGMAHALVERHGGAVPATMEELVELPGVARKTANVVLGTAFGKNEGMVVDTHISRLSQRLKLTRESEPVKIEKDLCGKLPQAKWTQIGHQLIWHGRRVCDARKPNCGACAL